MNSIGNYHTTNHSQINPQSSFQIRFLFYKLENLCKKIPLHSPDAKQNICSRIVVDLTNHFSSSLNIHCLAVDNQPITLGYTEQSNHKILTIVNKKSKVSYKLDAAKDHQVRFLLAEMSKKMMNKKHWKLSVYFKLQKYQKRVPVFLDQFSKGNFESVTSLDLSYTDLLRPEVELLMEKLPHLHRLILKGANQINWSTLTLPKTIRRLDLSETNICAKELEELIEKHPHITELILRETNQIDWDKLKLTKIIKKLDVSKTNISMGKIGEFFQSTEKGEIIADDCNNFPPIVSVITRYTFKLRENPCSPDLSFMKKNSKYNTPDFLSKFFKHVLSFPHNHKDTVFRLNGFNLSPEIKAELKKAKQSQKIKDFIID
ncbi:putative uncharacterized protein [Parachlamydia acanthamoebae UV-7]|uniref:Uncharacterized protein n=2 Tax=Parachlamydia acanthamoebae TaxID=83552 RepID=F8KZR0_PARAV|nr:hypothetical protein DB43_FM00210 [Parachlamydia acanthamoebae]CCB86414.1 putative uncharacterized protein [Parachlamydia acanthamoebae UV-7]